MIVLNLEQGSPEWLKARAGSLGASQIADALAKTRNGWGASRGNLQAKLIAERLTGMPQDTFCSPAMQWGKDTEEYARAAYEFQHGVTVETVGMVLHPELTGTHASPDGLVGDKGLLEIKCPNTLTHFETLDGAPIPQKYIYQMQWQMRCCGRDWCDWASYDPRVPESMKLHVERVERDDALIAELEEQVAEFIEEIDNRVARFRARYELKEAA